MIDISSEPMMFPVGGKLEPFARITVGDLHRLVAYANEQAIARQIAALGPDASPADRAATMREHTPYTLNDFGTLAQDMQMQMHLLYLCYSKTHSDVTEDAFLDMFSPSELPEMVRWVDLLSGFQPTDEAAIEGDEGNPPSAPEGAESAKAGQISAGRQS